MPRAVPKRCVACRLSTFPGPPIEYTQSQPGVRPSGQGFRDHSAQPPRSSQLRGPCLCLCACGWILNEPPHLSVASRLMGPSLLLPTLQFNLSLADRLVLHLRAIATIPSLGREIAKQCLLNRRSRFADLIIPESHRWDSFAISFLYSALAAASFRNVGARAVELDVGPNELSSIQSLCT